MKNNKMLLCISAIAAMLLTGCGGQTTTSSVTGPTTGGTDGGSTSTGGIKYPTETYYNSLGSVARKKEVSELETYFPENWSSIKTMQREDSKAIGNAVDGLVEVDRYGRFVPSLATEWSTSENDTVYKFKIRENVFWQKRDGSFYQSEGHKVAVKAQDWVTAITENLTAINASESVYFPMMFIKGASQYYAYTDASYKKAAGFGVVTQAKLDAYTGENAESVKSLCSVGTISNPSGTGLCAGVADPAAFTDEVVMKKAKVTSAAELEKVAKGEYLGVKASEDGKELTFTLLEPTPYFLSVLTYTPFLPVAQEAIDDIDFNYGKDSNNILYNGAFLIGSFSESTYTLVKNPQYWDASAVKLDKITRKKIDTTTFGPSTARENYERGEIDGFAINPKDTKGWEKYVGTEKNSNQYQNPTSEEVYALEGNGDGSTFVIYLNTHRDPGVWASTTSSVSKESVENTNKALNGSQKLRAAILSGLDYDVYNESNGSQYTDKAWNDKFTVNTFTPKNFIQDDKGIDYVDYVAAEQAKMFNSSSTSEKNDLSSGQISKRLSTTDAETKAKLAEAKAELAGSGVTFPVEIEFLQLPSSDTVTVQGDKKFIAYSNLRYNGCWSSSDDIGLKPETAKVCAAGEEVVKIVNNQKVYDTASSKVYQQQGNLGNFSMYIGGWGPDYSDPRTFADTVKINGDLATYVGLGDDGSDPELTKEVEKIAGKYTQLVEEAAKLTDLNARYKKFAEAEVELLYNTSILRPLYMAGLGPTVQISNFIPYRGATVAFGLSQDKYKHTEATAKPLTPQQKKALKDEFTELKKQVFAN